MREHEGAVVPAPLSTRSRRTPEVWGGVECTVNRVGDRYIDQLRLSGHDRRVHDLERFASLGITTIRYPVLWERVAPHGLHVAGWSWSDLRLRLLVELGLSPIVGLLHHGSGPCDTHLLDPAFPRKFTAYAQAFATRYPWVTRVTPINEPLTTARFSGLYGVWYPHRRNDRAFARMFMHQCVATRAAMRVMRAVNPAVQLVQTEDLGYTHAVPRLHYQAEFENHRRWLTFDMLCGRVTPAHPLYGYLRACGLSERELAEFADDPCPPALIGINHYITSERYLDDDLDVYPHRMHGGNGRHRYVDTEVARAAPVRRLGARHLLWEAWERYGMPIAVTEAHLGCPDERQQIRWLAELWDAVRTLRDRCDVRAMTAWALLGSFGWDQLVTRDGGTYEAGAFTLRNVVPEETSVADMVRSLSSVGSYSGYATHGMGWWEHDTHGTSSAVLSA